MIAAVCFGTNDLAHAGEFYNQVLATVGMSRLDASENEIGYDQGDGDPVFRMPADCPV